MANIYDNLLLQNILFPKTPQLGENLYNPPGRRILASRIRPEVDTEPLSYAGLSPINLMPDPDYPEFAEIDKGATGTIPTLALDNTGIISALRNNAVFGTSEDNYQGFTDKEDFSKAPEPTGLQTLLSFLPFGSNSIGGRILGGIRNFFDFKNSPMYRPAGAGVFGFSPAELNRMNALGGFYSEPARENRRRANRISKILQRAAANKNYSEKNLQNLMNQFDMGDVDTRGMIDSIRQSADMGYGKGDVGQAATPDRDYSSSPGAMAGDMEYGEE